MNKNSTPNVTVIVCHKDYQLYLPDSIKSAKTQTYKNIRTCIIDGGSKDFDSVLSICEENLFNDKKYQKHVVDENCDIYSDGMNSLMHFKNGVCNGPSFARNRGIELYSKDTHFFMVLDSDDSMMPDKVRSMVQEVLDSPNPAMVGAVYGDTTILNTETGKLTQEYREPYSIQRLQQECIVHSNSLVSAHVFSDVGLYDESLRVAEDYDLWLRIAKKYAILHIAKPLTLVRVQPMNSTATVSKDIWEQCLRKIRMKHSQ